MDLTWLFSGKEYKAVILRIPNDMDHAIETIRFINGVEKEEIILTALDEYLRKNLWFTNDSGSKTQIKRLRQMRK